MRILLTFLLSLSLILPAGNRAAAQDFVPTPVEISKEKVNINGSLYWLHKVLKGQTLYSISKAYGVTVEDIQTANPTLSEGLKAGMLLYIPEKTQAKAVTPETAAPETVTEVTATAVEKSAAPAADKAKAQKKLAKDKKKYKKYNIKWYETLDDVAVKFNVTVEALVALNGIDTSSDRRVRSVLIPDDEYMRSMTDSRPALETPAEETVPDQKAEKAVFTAHGQKSEPVQEDRTAAVPFGTETVTISLVLPFNASRQTDGINAYTADFYAGALIAVADLKEQGLFSGYELEVIDLNRYGSAWELVADNVLSGSSLIIGPISERDMQPIASYARSRRIPVVSPLDLKTAELAVGNPYFYLFPPQSDLALSHQIDKIADMSDADTTESVTVIYEQGYDRSDLVTQTMSELGARGIHYKTFSYDFLSGRGIDTLMSMSMDTLLLNKVIIPSMSEAFITDALRNLNLIKSGMGYRVEVYGLSRWKSFETVELDYFHALDLRLAMSYHIDYNDPATMDFIRKYRAAFNTEPSSFAFQGYDIMTFFVSAMNTYGSNFPSGILNERKSLLQSDVLFLPVAPGSGYENRAFKDICFTKGWQVLNE